MGLDVEKQGEEGGETVGFCLATSNKAGKGVGDVQACDGEGSTCFKQAAHHDAGLGKPCRDGATVCDGPPDVPGQKAEAEDPEDGECGVIDQIIRGR